MLVYQGVAREVFPPHLYWHTSLQHLPTNPGLPSWSWRELKSAHPNSPWDSRTGHVTRRWTNRQMGGFYEFPEFSMFCLWEEQKMAVQIWIEWETCSPIWRWDFLEIPGYLFGVHDYPWLYEGSLDPSTYEPRIKPSYFPLNPGCLMTGSFVMVYCNPHIAG